MSNSVLRLQFLKLSVDSFLTSMRHLGKGHHKPSSVELVKEDESVTRSMGNYVEHRREVQAS